MLSTMRHTNLRYELGSISLGENLAPSAHIQWLLSWESEELEWEMFRLVLYAELALGSKDC